MAVTSGKAHHPLYYDLAGIVGLGYVTDDDFVLETYSRDTSPLPPNKQGIVVRPVNTDQVVDIVKLSNSSKIPIVPSGGRASFYGTPKGLHGKGIVVDMTRMNKMISIDHVNTTVTAEAGMTTSELAGRLWDEGWDIHTAFMPYYPDTIGGQLSGFAGGGCGLELAYAGWNATYVAGVKVVLPDASVVQTGGGAGTNINCSMIYDRYVGTPDLTGIFIGDGGTFGIKVAATYRMIKWTPLREPYLYSYDTMEKAWEVVQEISLIEPLPYYHICIIPHTETTKKEHGMDKEIVVGAIKGNTEAELKANRDILQEVCLRHGGVKTEGFYADAWKEAIHHAKRYREMGTFGTPGTWSFFEYFASRSQALDCHLTMKKYIWDRLDKEGIEYEANLGFVPSTSTSWILTFIIWVRGEDKRAQQFLSQLFAEATEYACSRGWYPDCHQGWGTRMMAKYWPKEHYEFMKKMKRALDPNNIMNPGVWDL